MTEVNANISRTRVCLHLKQIQYLIPQYEAVQAPLLHELSRERKKISWLSVLLLYRLSYMTKMNMTWLGRNNKTHKRETNDLHARENVETTKKIWLFDNAFSNILQLFLAIAAKTFRNLVVLFCTILLGISAIHFYESFSFFSFFQTSYVYSSDIIRVIGCGFLFRIAL